jgi:hypothetical protein
VACPSADRGVGSKVASTPKHWGGCSQVYQDVSEPCISHPSHKLTYRYIVYRSTSMLIFLGWTFPSHGASHNLFAKQTLLTSEIFNQLAEVDRPRHAQCLCVQGFLEVQSAHAKLLGCDLCQCGPSSQTPPINVTALTSPMAHFIRWIMNGWYCISSVCSSMIRQIQLNARLPYTYARRKVNHSL